MKKRRVLFAALLICFSLSFKEANATDHIQNQDLTDPEYTGYNASSGGVLYNNEDTHNITGSTLRENTATSSGGAVYNSATLNVQGAKFEDNTATSDRGKGGAIYNEGTMTVEDSSFSSNKASARTELWQEEGEGGALYNKSKATFTNSTFTGNHARYGGAIYNYTEDADLTVQGTFKGNTAQTGGAINNNEGKVTVGQDSVFENNSTTRYEGGAITNNDGIVDIGDNVTFKNNTAFNKDEDAGMKSGGAIFSQGDGKSQIQIGKEVKFEGNKSEDGGAIGLYKHNDVTIGDNVTFKNNQAGHSGGAIYLYTIDTDPKASSFTIGNNAVFEGNQAGFDNEEGYTKSVVFGGAISINQQSYQEGQNSSFKIGENAVFRNNKAGIDSSTVSGYGGAIYNAAYDTTVGNNALFEGNIATYAGGAICNYGGDLTIGANSVFKNNKATASNSLGGAIYNTNSLHLGENAVFDSNVSTDRGGAIFNYSGGTENQLSKATFLNNSANSGGAVYAHTSKLGIKDSVFYKNSAKTDAGALYVYADVNVENSLFEDNSSGNKGGAIYNITTQATENKLTVNNSQFTKNKAMVGGAIAASGSNTTTNVTNSNFKNNYVLEQKSEDGTPMGGQGGAIWTGANASNTLNVEGSVFENNTAEAEGGAIWSGGQTDIKGSLFKGNRSDGKNFTSDKPDFNHDNEGGGAIFVGSSSKTNIEKSDFINNSSSTVGGAIATRSNASGDSSSLTIKGATFQGNSAKQNGGAIASYTGTTITDTSFVNNKADKKGGAIWANDDVTINATESDIVFLGNSAEDGGDIYMDNKSTSGSMGNLTLSAGENKNITLADGISGAQQYDVTVNGAGKVTFNSEIKNANMNVTAGTLHLAQGSSLGEGTKINVTGATLDSQDGQINDYSGKVFMGENSKLKVDLSPKNRTTDKFSPKEGLAGNVKVEDFNFLPDTIISYDTITTSEIKDALGLGDEVNLELPEQSFTTLTPLRYENVTIGANGVSYTPTGNTFNDFNPAVTTAPVAAQLGGYLTQLDSYDEAFRNMDMYMLMPKSMRQAMKFRNKYAAAESDWNVIYDKAAAPYDNTALWARPYATFENVRLRRGPKVSNVSWGTFMGGDSELFDLGNGWEGMWSLYAGYNGSHQAYQGISIYQNGGTLGLTGTLYKNNFFTGLTANAGANSVEASTNYGDDSFGLFRTGVASKTGYNVEFADGKFIIQPSWLMSYSFINTGDYTTSNGIRISSNPLNVLQLEPGLKFIGNVGNGWQPYTGLSIVWNLFDKTDFRASDATLPELSVKPFFKYGLGLRKLCGERFVGYGQTYFTSGGRNGIGVQFGGRWTI